MASYQDITPLFTNMLGYDYAGEANYLSKLNHNIAIPIMEDYMNEYRKGAFTGFQGKERSEDGSGGFWGDIHMSTYARLLEQKYHERDEDLKQQQARAEEQRKAEEAQRKAEEQAKQAEAVLEQSQNKQQKGNALKYEYKVSHNQEKANLTSGLTGFAKLRRRILGSDDKLNSSAKLGE